MKPWAFIAAAMRAIWPASPAIITPWTPLPFMLLTSAVKSVSVGSVTLEYTNWYPSDWAAAISPLAASFADCTSSVKYAILVITGGPNVVLK